MQAAPARQSLGEQHAAPTKQAPWQHLAFGPHSVSEVQVEHTEPRQTRPLHSGTAVVVLEQQLPDRQPPLQQTEPRLHSESVVHWVHELPRHTRPAPQSPSPQQEPATQLPPQQRWPALH